MACLMQELIIKNMHNFIEYIYNIFSYICHQNPQRSFYINNTPFFLCSRCSGIYLAMISTLIISSFFNIRFSFLKLFILLIIVLMLNLSTFIEFFDTNLIRFLLGSLIGIFSGLIMIKSIIILKTKGDRYEQ